MLQNYSRYRVLREFFREPRKSFQMREISRNINLAQVSVINHLNALLKEGLIQKETAGIYPSFKANRNNEEFKILKRQDTLLRLHKSGLIQEIEEKARPNCIVLFGSASRGEDTESSDIDLFVQSEEANISLKKYEKLLVYNVHILYGTDLKTLSRELLNNIINGIVVYGYLKVV